MEASKTMEEPETFQLEAGDGLAAPPCSAVVVYLKMEGSKRNRAKVQRMVESAINETLKDMTWHFIGKGKVEVEWEISSQNS